MNNNLDIVLEAVEFASLAHQGVNRGGPRGVPYLNHVLDVCRRLNRHGFDNSSTLVAGVLHDTVEDTEVTLAEIEARFGKRVADLVDHLTLPLDCRRDREKKQAFQSAQMKIMDVEGQGIKIGDKTSNTYDLIVDPPNWSPRAIRGYTEGAREIVLLADTSDPRIRSMVAEFERVYDELSNHYKWGPR